VTAYFLALMRREEGIATGIRPLLPARFAAPGANEITAPPDDEVRSALAPAPALASETAVPGPVHPRAERAPAPDPPPGRPAEPVASGALQPALPRAPGPADAARARSDPDSRAREPLEAIPSPPVGRESRTPARVDRPDHAEASQSLVAARLTEGPSPEARPAPRTEESARVLDPAPPAPRREPRLPGPVGDPPARRREPEPAPTVRVTIGRVEVRPPALPSSPTPAPVRVWSPELSLADYLRERSR
jgi:hypothetical protein